VTFDIIIFYALHFIICFHLLDKSSDVYSLEPIDEKHLANTYVMLYVGLPHVTGIYITVCPITESLNKDST
jgi:hypothetical protein